MMPKKPYPILISSLLFVLLLSSCGSDDAYDSETDYAEDYSSIEDEPLMNGWRAGTLQVEVNLVQSADFVEAKEGETTTANWQYHLQAKSIQKVKVIDDLTRNVPVSASLSAEERLDAFGNGPYYKLDNGGEAIVTGNIKYQSSFINVHPNDITTIRLEQTSSGSGKVKRLNLSNFEISKFGIGYEFDLTLFADIDHKGLMKATARNGTVSEMNNDKIITDEKNFSFLPAADHSVLALYPYEEELEGLPANLIEESKKFDLSLFDYRKKLTNGEVEFLHKDFPNTKTTASKDKLVVHYNLDNEKVIPFIGDMVGLVATPDQRVFSVTVTLTVD